ncbi:LysR family transcriptional regulator [Corallococcus macrosporus]|uniref:LysR family transcriptional regulator n=1 Tax=Myxococcus fulvus (strain ATCC BAA-855 / HW-1) TaxID=483219 RepID=F8CLP7_MYXFH|nr:LysR family transcriptional regulator [Corallococcus macrosporus]AEI67756.1 LysR family transcriptional regulator [Corallococcus macrosporus]
MRLDLADCRLFLCIVDAGSITQGAQRANLTLASASERLRSIEDAVGVKLLERRPRGVVTTEAGDALVHHARLMLQQQALLKDELEDFVSGRRGTLRLHANTAALTEFLPEKLAPWLARNPRVNVELRERASADIVKAVEAGLAEAGLISDAVETRALQVRPVEPHPLVLIIPAGHALASAASLALSDVQGEPFVGLAPDSALQEHLNGHARRAGFELSYRVRMKDFRGLCELVSHGVGLGIVPERVAWRHHREGTYRRVPLSDAWAQRRLCVCFQDWERLSAPVRDLLEHLLAV